MNLYLRMKLYLQRKGVMKKPLEIKAFIGKNESMEVRFNTQTGWAMISEPWNSKNFVLSDEEVVKLYEFLTQALYQKD